MILIKNHRSRIGKTATKTACNNLNLSSSSITLSTKDGNNQIDHSKRPRTICYVCTISASRYCCKRCLCQYCSAKCYQQHSLVCTEEFYRGRVKSVLDLEKKK